jgi:hypothetical protein
MKELMALWNKVAQDELAFRPAYQHVADILLVACSHYVDLVALEVAFMKQLRQFNGLCKDAEYARRAAEDDDTDLMLGKRRWPQGGSDSANSAATTPRSAASTPGGATSSRPRLGPPEDGPPEEEEEDDGPRELAFAADMEEVPIPVRGNGPAAASRGAGNDSQRERRCCLQVRSWRCAAGRRTRQADCGVKCEARPICVAQRRGCMLCMSVL